MPQLLLLLLASLLVAAAVPPATETVTAADAAVDATAAGRHRPPGTTVRWYRVAVGGDDIGYMYALWSVNASGVRYVEEMNFGVRRGSDTVAMFALTESVETHAGTLVRMAVTQKTAQAAAVSEFAFNGSGFSVLTSGGSFAGGAAQFVAVSPEERGFLSRVAAQEHFEGACRAGDQRHVVATVRPELGATVVPVTHVRRSSPPPGYDAAAVAVAGAGATADSQNSGYSHWETTMGAVPLTIYETYSADCRTLARSQMQSPFGPLVVQLATEAEVQPILRTFAAGDFSASQFPEIVHSAEVPLAFPLPSVTRAQTARFLVGLARGSGGDDGDFDGAPFTLPNSGFQIFDSTVRPAPPQGATDGAAVAPIDAGEVGGVLWVGAITVDLRPAASHAAAPGAAVEEVDGAYLAASTMINSDDPGVRDLHRTLLEAAGLEAFPPTVELTTAAQRLTRVGVLRDGVRRYITRKDLNSGHGSASEVVASRAGDCTEHAVLLAALLRVDGTPARVCNGLVYTESSNSHGGASADAGPGSGLGSDPGRRMNPAFAWHMWTQAFVGGRWVDSDATLPQPQGFHVGHILVSTEALDGATVISDSVLAMLPLLKTLRVQVLSVDGVRPRRPAPDLPPASAIRVGVLPRPDADGPAVGVGRCGATAVARGDRVNLRVAVFLRRTGGILDHTLWARSNGSVSPTAPNASARDHRPLDTVVVGTSGAAVTTTGGTHLPGVVVDRAIVGACAHDRRSVQVPGNSAFGARGRPPYVHADATIIYDVEVVGIVSPGSRDEL